ncbi:MULTISPECIES: hypothetical protein [Bacillus]|uniref:Pesticidal crystal protein Cry domain-containing protein n=1 Tax=Bacillus cereus TaxID=1396 RepID=A0A9X6B8X4_BACCE|nr:hypothetical protein [Bacillus cereus]OOR74152.1 hypothetical protein BLX06_15590 [Bacillus cereus]
MTILNMDESMFSQVNFNTLQDLRNITAQVNALFTNLTKDQLALNTSDYWIDQVVMKVDLLDPAVFGKEKKQLRQQVNKAKQLCKMRNLLKSGNFENINTWIIGRKVVITNHNPLFKGKHALLPPASIYPSYVYQKVDESKLKSHTRYLFSGFASHAQDLQVVVSRYGKEVDETLQIPFETAFSTTSEATANCCQPVSNLGEPTTMISNPSSSQDTHYFQYTIDVGSLQSDYNVGIEVGFKIISRTGMARLSNIELREQRPLTAKEIRDIQRKEQIWRQQLNQEEGKVITTLQSIVKQLNRLYQNEDWNGSIKSYVMYQDVTNISLPDLPNQKHWFMSDREGPHAAVTRILKQAVNRAFQQVEDTNWIKNGSFTKGFDGWSITGDVNITVQYGRPMLEFNHWDAQVQKTIIVPSELDKEYILRVRTQGLGTITLQDDTNTYELAMNRESFQIKMLEHLSFSGPSITVSIQSENNAFVLDTIELIAETNTDLP